jgi:hypothetical protein
MVKIIKYTGKTSSIQDETKKIIGKTHGTSYQFLDDNYNTIQPNGAIQCKDFLQDVVYCETCLHPNLKIYNYNYSFTNTFNNQSKLILALNYNVTDSVLIDIVSNLQLFLNNYESELNFTKTIIMTDDDKTIALVHFGKEWISSPALFSLFTLFLRYCINYTSTQTIAEYLKQPLKMTLIDDNDVFLFKNKNEKLLNFILNLNQELISELPTWQSLTDAKDYSINYPYNSELAHRVHYSGIMSYLSKTK